jgi:hypothetical protein
MYCLRGWTRRFWWNEAKSKEPVKLISCEYPSGPLCDNAIGHAAAWGDGSAKIPPLKGLHFTLPLRMSGQGTSPRFQARQLDPDPRSPDRTLIICAHGVRTQIDAASKPRSKENLRADAFQIVEGDTNGRRSFGRPNWNRSRPIPVRSRHPNPDDAWWSTLNRVEPPKSESASP